MRPQTLSTILRSATRQSAAAPARIVFARHSSSSSEHGQESFESFSDRYVQFFQSAQDLFELQRGLNNCFAHDLVPSPAVIEAALRAARRVNDYSTAVRVFEGIREKVENKQQYQAYLEELKGVREELGEIPCALSVRGTESHPSAYRRRHQGRLVFVVIMGTWYRTDTFSAFECSRPLSATKETVNFGPLIHEGNVVTIPS
jgi:cytochrome c oxidase subunit 5a